MHAAAMCRCYCCYVPLLLLLCAAATAAAATAAAATAAAATAAALKPHQKRTYSSAKALVTQKERLPKGGLERRGERVVNVLPDPQKRFAALQHKNVHTHNAINKIKVGSAVRWGGGCWR